MNTPDPRRARDSVRFTSPRVRPSFLVAAGVGALFILVVALPRARRGEPVALPPNPAEEAAALYDAFTERATAGSAHEPQAGGSARDDARRLPRDLFRPETALPPPVYAPVEPMEALESADSLSRAPAPRQQPRLEGMFIDGRSAHAVINGRVVAEGDSVAGGWVIQIRRDGVTWLSPRQTYVRLDWRPSP